MLVALIEFCIYVCIGTVIYWSHNDGLRWGRYCWGPLLIGGVVGRCCRVAKWPASVGWRFSDIGNWFPDIGKSNTFPDIGKSIPDIRKSFPDIGKLIISRYRKLISRYREIIPDLGKCWIKTQMAFHKGAPARVTIGPTSKIVNDGMNIATVTAEVFQLIKADRRTRANHSQKFHSIRANSTELLNWQYSTLRIAYYRSDSYCFFCTDIDPERLHMSSGGSVEQSDSSWLDECFYHFISVRRGPLSCVSVSQWQRHRQVVAGFALWWRAGWQSRRKTQHTDPGWLVSISEVDALVRKGYQEWSSAFNTLVQIFISTD